MEAIRGVDIELAAGEFVAVMGPSGSGKSTCCTSSGGSSPPPAARSGSRGSGSTAVHRGLVILRRRHVGFVFQFFNLLSNMTVADNVELPVLLAGATRGRPGRREELLAELGIPTRRRGPGPAVRRRAAARGAGPGPGQRASLLLADEPTGNLDSSNTRDVLRLLRRAHAGGQAILMVTHDAGWPAWPTGSSTCSTDGGRRRPDRAARAGEQHRRRRGAEG